jgi:hypothetical protein
MGLKARVVCSIQLKQSAFYFLDTDINAGSYTVLGSDYFRNNGGDARAYLYYGGAQHTLVTGLGPIDYTQAAAGGNAVSQIVVESTTGGGQMTGQLTVTRGAKSAVVHFDVYRSTTLCWSRADITPAA